MPAPSLNQEQLDLVSRPPLGRTFLRGPAGAGKTTAAVERMLHLLETGTAAEPVLLLLPQRTLGRPFQEALQQPGVRAGGLATTVTLGGLARRMVDLFWPLVAEEAGFARPDRPPNFLTLETAQYYMAFLVRPLFAEGFFETVVIDRNRLYSQIIDNLNKAALVGFPHTDIGQRLTDAAQGDLVQARIYADAQTAANRFRAYCLENNLLDFSLQVQVFIEHLWPFPLCREYLFESYRHLIAENLEENPPVVFDLLHEWLPELDSALLVFDEQAGFRTFLGADPQEALKLQALCDETVTLATSFVSPPHMEAFRRRLSASLGYPQDTGEPSLEDQAPALAFEFHRYYPEMLDWVADEIARLIFSEGISPAEIVVLAPYLGDALRFTLSERLNRLGVPHRAHRPSRALREEAATQCLLSLALCAHPEWMAVPSQGGLSNTGLALTPFDLAYAFLQAIDGLDLVRAQLLAEIVFRKQDGRYTLSSFDAIKPQVQERITYTLGGAYERLRLWIDQYQSGPPQELDHFFSRLFGEVLSQAGYGFHADTQAGAVTANLVESVQKFRWVAGEQLAAAGVSLGREYLGLVKDGVIAAQYIRGWEEASPEEVYLAPAYTFVMSNRPVDYQFWLDVGGRGWYERLYQPLTHPHVLSRRWDQERTWTDADEQIAGLEALHALSQGLLRRCRRRVYLGLSQLNEQGYEGRGLLLRAIDRALRAPQDEGQTQDD